MSIGSVSPSVAIVTKLVTKPDGNACIALFGRRDAATEYPASMGERPGPVNSL